MAANKTSDTGADVGAFIAGIPDPGRRADAQALRAIMERLSGEPARMWGANIIGFGAYHYRYDSAREGDAPRIGFSPRAKELVLYVMHGFPDDQQLLAGLGRHRAGKSCLYIKRLSDVDPKVLEELIGSSLAGMDRTYPRTG